MSRPTWMDRAHEFVENVNDGSMCLCGMSALHHDLWELGEQQVRDAFAGVMSRDNPASVRPRDTDDPRDIAHYVYHRIEGAASPVCVGDGTVTVTVMDGRRELSIGTDTSSGDWVVWEVVAVASDGTRDQLAVGWWPFGDVGRATLEVDEMIRELSSEESDPPAA